MHRRTKRIIGAVAVVAAVAAGGAAYTASNTITQPSLNVAGYGKATVSGAKVVDTHYDLSSDGTLIERVKLDFNPAINGTSNSLDGTADIVMIGFGDANTNPTSVQIPCDVAPDGTYATCGALEGSPSALRVTNSDTVSGTLAVAVSHP